jgi:translation elongation factor EF-Tu-like GTPase
VKTVDAVRPGDVIRISVELIRQIQDEGGRTESVRLKEIEVDEETGARILWLEKVDA